jgi:fimbrial chaperone protein
MNKWSQLLLVVLMFLMAPVHAFKLTPIEAEFGPGRLAVQTFKVENPGALAVAVELSVHARTMAASGEDVLMPAPEAFAVFPDQIVLQPGETQSVRVQWTGTDIPQTEIAYRLMAEQLPITLGDEGERSGLRLMVKYLAALYVRPADPAAVLAAEIGSEVRDGQKVAVIKVDNTGNAHAVLQAAMVEVSAGGASLWSTALNSAKRCTARTCWRACGGSWCCPGRPRWMPARLTVVLKQPPAGTS